MGYESLSGEYLRLEWRLSVPDARGDLDRDLRCLRFDRSVWSSSFLGLFFFRNISCSSSSGPLSTLIAMSFSPCESTGGACLSFSLVRFHISFLTHFRQSTTLTRADLLSPCSVYAKGSSKVVSGTGGASSSRKRVSKWYSQRVFPQVVSPDPARTSSSVLQRRENCNIYADRQHQHRVQERQAHVARFVVLEITHRKFAVEV